MTAFITSRTDFKRDGHTVRCPNASNIGFSGPALNPGMFFTFSHGGDTYLARMHYRMVEAPPLEPGEEIHKGLIVAQVANASMTNHYERWIDPKHVIETWPAYRMEPEIVSLFDRKINMHATR